MIYVGRRKIRDTRRRVITNFNGRSSIRSNAYFVTNGLRAGAENIIRSAVNFTWGESTQLFARQETRGYFRSLTGSVRRDWHDGDTANLCIGQGEIAVTPIQMAVMFSTIANAARCSGRALVSRVKPQDPASGEVATNYFRSGVVRDRLTVRPAELQIGERDAWRTDSEAHRRLQARGCTGEAVAHHARTDNSSPPRRDADLRFNAADDQARPETLPRRWRSLKPSTAIWMGVTAIRPGRCTGGRVPVMPVARTDPVKLRKYPVFPGARTVACFSPR